MNATAWIVVAVLIGSFRVTAAAPPETGSTEQQREEEERRKYEEAEQEKYEDCLASKMPPDRCDAVREARALERRKDEEERRRWDSCIADGGSPSTCLAERMAALKLEEEAAAARRKEERQKYDKEQNHIAMEEWRAWAAKVRAAAPPCRLEERLVGVVVGKVKGLHRYEVAVWTYGDSGPCGSGGHPISCQPGLVPGEHVLLSAKRAHGENEDILVCIDPKKTRTVKVVANSGFSRWIKAYVER